ncbi:hypothetical protein Vadar_011613 [Vaccinium darrowii]|uniref:Uncharacterized protein n=1 Tax=Vaccinium darrowii TaxID=229202 RepID=A0ACB7XPX7_9ERIC|nr:hypothetical protein Vadar_011613 [Vaccinium darrowii]
MANIGASARIEAGNYRKGTALFSLIRPSLCFSTIRRGRLLFHSHSQSSNPNLTTQQTENALPRKQRSLGPNDVQDAEELLNRMALMRPFPPIFQINKALVLDSGRRLREWWIAELRRWNLSLGFEGKGYSHKPKEFLSNEDIANGVKVLALPVAKLTCLCALFYVSHKLVVLCRRLMAGSEALSKALNETVDSKNTSFLDAARSAGYAEGVDLSSVFLKKEIYSAFVELHIEQGPIREEEGISIGIVTAIAAPASIKVDFEGNGGHAGAVLMPIGLAAAELALAVEKHVLDSGSIYTVDARDTDENQ